MKTYSFLTKFCHIKDVWRTFTEHTGKSHQSQEKQNRVNGLERELRNILLFRLCRSIIYQISESDSDNEKTHRQDCTEVSLYRKQRIGKDGSDDTARKSTQTPQTMKRRHDVAPIHFLHQTSLGVGSDVHQIRHHSESHQRKNQLEHRTAASHTEQHNSINHLSNQNHLLAAKLAHQNARKSHHQKLTDGNGEKHRSQLSVAQVQHLFYIRNTACPTGKHHSRHKIISRNSHSLTGQISQVIQTYSHPY